jgi:metallo-beta-lactamase family protein
MVKLSFWGAAGGVTGSCFLIETSKGNLLVDCGLFQGPGAEEKNREVLGFNPKELKAVLNTHAHLDHCGRLPILAANGFSGQVFATQPSCDFFPILLYDAAKVSGLGGYPALYSDDEVEKLLQLLKPVEYHQWYQIIPGVEARWWDAGHMLGSASVEVRLAEWSNQSLIFSGDLGNVPSPIVRETDQPEAVAGVIMESTYGGRNHPPRGEEIHVIESLCRQVEEGNGTLLIPAFSLERTQEFLHIFDHLKREGKISNSLPVFLDSPMALKATAVFENYPQYFNDHLKTQFQSDDPFDFPGLQLVEQARESKKISKIQRSKVIIAGSGMMSGGRVMHHAKKLLPDKRTVVLINGFQAEGTTGREVLERHESVVIDGLEVPVKASIVEVTSMSGHAGHDQLLAWVGKMSGIQKIFLVHGETDSRIALSQALPSGPEKILPEMGSSYELK